MSPLSILIAKFLAALTALAAVGAIATNVITNHNSSDNGGSSDNQERPSVAAPEIDAASGAKGLAVLIGALLLAAEGLRRRQ